MDIIGKANGADDGNSVRSSLNDFGGIFRSNSADADNGQFKTVFPESFNDIYTLSRPGVFFRLNG